MPIYEYRCQACGKDLEVLVRSGKEPTTCEGRCLSLEHEEANQGELKRKISRAGIIFKGTGFHVNDYSGNGGSKSTPSSTGADSSSSDSSSGSSDSASTTSSKTESTSSSTSSSSD
ncbi:MAG: FmdB family zinc ribbon protein [Vulcanimicrobiota bacterium]